MGNFTRLMTKYKIEYKDFEKWLHKGGSQVVRLETAYQNSLKRLEIAGLEHELWVARHCEDEFFDVAVLIKRRYLEHLEAVSMARLERLFDRYRHDAAGLERSEQQRRRRKVKRKP
jgi:hypothetical protein